MSFPEGHNSNRTEDKIKEKERHKVDKYIMKKKNAHSHGLILTGTKCNFSQKWKCTVLFITLITESWKQVRRDLKKSSSLCLATWCLTWEFVSIRNQSDFQIKG